MTRITNTTFEHAQANVGHASVTACSQGQQELRRSADHERYELFLACAKWVKESVRRFVAAYHQRQTARWFENGGV